MSTHSVGYSFNTAAIRRLSTYPSLTYCSLRTERCAGNKTCIGRPSEETWEVERNRVDCAHSVEQLPACAQYPGIVECLCISDICQPATTHSAVGSLQRSELTIPARLPILHQVQLTHPVPGECRRWWRLVLRMEHVNNVSGYDLPTELQRQWQRSELVAEVVVV